MEDANIRSPNGTKPMRRAYGYLPTREAAAAFGADYAEYIYERNVGLQTKCMEEEFASASSEQKWFEQRRRDRKRRDINKEKYGTARRPSLNEVKSAKTPRMKQPGRAHWSAATGVMDCTDGPVERELEYDQQA